jgi:hypothetical protein
MFYLMKLEILFVAASLILVTGIVAVALPNPVQATPHLVVDKSCSGPGVCFKTKGQCYNSIPKDAINTCQKILTPT